MAWILFGTFIALILMRVPISIAIGTATVLTFLTSDFSSAMQIIPQQMLEGVNKASLTAVPFFIMAGNLMNATGVTERIFAFANALVGHLKAGLAQVNILSSMIFAGISGAAVADCAGLGAIEIKAMRERGYKSDFAAAITVASSVIGPLIPPSIGLVLYAFLAQQSIERMFLAGLVPGILVGLSLMLYVRFRAQFEEFPTQPRATPREIAGSAKHGFLALVAPAIILGSIMFGFVTATEAGVLACIYCIIIGLWYKELTFRAFVAALSDTAMMTAVIMIIIAFSIAMGWLLAIDQTPQKLADFTFALTEDKNVFLALLLVFIILVGCVVEGVPAKLILVPTLLPLIDAYGIDRVHFGIIIQLGLLMGIATPPMGIGLYIVAEVGRVRFEKVTMAVLPMLIPLLAVLLLLTYVPQTVTFLPDLILGPQN
ncbi:MAG: TRAP transporter large permease [Rhodobacteraceae bacterium]|jgi:tripartite ATP-independent transporter DctM subunit|uniref:TRAP transporter large permease protein n=1 Tax=Salipiger profundus TaxID=1229727 RepID=A0A1U7D7J0_9RHOB|nr:MULTISPECIES: TRAP transporter large permease [Salipiger]APX24134.1 TRAP transporter, DctM subunit [Salipiger profundus]MAB06921.1 TRAP transporter large permease [Paracoccaceae bacterium]GFZ94858.1 ABC transporter permease [Salipiger profundus]SFB90123.1 TRAP transporter, DctM subunit [Salipiger profundus]